MEAKPQEPVVANRGMFFGYFYMDDIWHEGWVPMYVVMRPEKYRDYDFGGADVHEFAHCVNLMNSVLPNNYYGA